MRKRSISMGLVLLVTVLLVTVLVEVSVLSLSAARSDMVRAQALARSSESYYAACNEAEAVRSALVGGTDPGTELLRHDGQVSFQVPIDEGRILRVVLREDTWEILSWQTVVPPSP